MIALEGGATLRIAACDLSGMAPGSRLVQYNEPGNTVSLGPTCKLP